MKWNEMGGGKRERKERGKKGKRERRGREKGGRGKKEKSFFFFNSEISNQSSVLSDIRYSLFYLINSLQGGEKEDLGGVDEPYIIVYAPLTPRFESFPRSLVTRSSHHHHHHHLYPYLASYES